MNRLSRPRSHRSHHRTGWIFVVWLLVAMWLPCHAAAQVSELSHQVKAAMLFKFLSYIEWPPQVFATADSPYVIAVASSSEIAEELLQITDGRTVSGRPIIVKKVSSKDSLRDVHVLFVGASASDPQQQRLFKRASEKPLVTITENETGLVQGSIINFRVINDRIGFDVSLRTADARKVKMSSRLLAVASFVETGQP